MALMQKRLGYLIPFDLVTLQFVIHELPRQATRAISGKPYGSTSRGHLAIVDNNPQSPVIQNLPLCCLRS